MRSASLTDKTLGACDRAACRADERAKPMLEAVVEWLATTLDAGTLQSTFGTALLATLAAPSAARRPVAVTVAPAASSRRASTPPRKPVAPVTRTRS